jgi:hypothetical protein
MQAFSERSFRPIRGRIKSYMRSTKMGNKLSKFGIRHINREIVVDVTNLFCNIKTDELN